MRKSSVWLCGIALNCLLLGAACLQAALVKEQRSQALERKADLVRELQLTDLCLFTEARYTRHPSQTDFNTPFQDHPLSLEHFPSGSLVLRRAERAEYHAELD